MAERISIKVPAGEKHVHNVTWAEEGESTEGTLEWSLVVLGAEQTVDLDIVATTKPEGRGRGPSSIRLQQPERQRTFRGSFEPAEDKRLLVDIFSPRGDREEGEAPVDRPEVESVVFVIDNTFSWFAEKTVELVLVRERPRTGPPDANVRPLPSLEPEPPLPRPAPGTAPAPSPEPCGPRAPSAASPTAPPGRAGATAAAAEFAERLDGWLAEAAESCPNGHKDQWLEFLLVQVGILRKCCAEGPPLEADQQCRDTEEQPNHRAEEGAPAEGNGPVHFFIGDDKAEDEEGASHHRQT